MRMNIPEEISKLADKIAPYMIFVREQGGFVLAKDAPLEIVEAQKRYQQWMEANKSR